jgi:paraquat-inducible protein B
MSAKASYFRLGLFMILGVALLVGGVIVLGAGNLFKETVAAETFFDESVQGLGVGSAVRFRGVEIGTVSRIGFLRRKYPDSSWAKDPTFGKYILVEMDLDPAQLPIPGTKGVRQRLSDAVGSGLRLRMASSGLVGAVYLAADVLDPKTFPPPEIDWTPKALFVPSAPSTMSQVMSTIEELAAELKAADLTTVIGNISKFFVTADKAVTQLEVAKISEQGVGLLKELRATNESLKKVIEDPRINQGLDDLTAAIKGLRGVVDESGAPVTKALKDLPEISTRLKATTKRIDEVLADPKVDQIITGLAKTAENAGPAVVDLRKTLRRLDNLLATQEQDIRAIIGALRKVLENVETLSEDAKDNPSRLLFGDPPPREDRGERK